MTSDCTVRDILVNEGDSVNANQVLIVLDINEVFGKKVLERRLSLKISQETLANMADIDRTYLPDIEKGKRNVSLRVADKIAKALNVSLKDLL